MKPAAKSDAEKTRGETTRSEINAAITRIKAGRPRRVQPGRKLSVASVAEEAGISRALIHNSHPDLAEKIRADGGTSVRTQRDAKTEEAKEARAKNRVLRQELSEQRELNRALVSRMATLTLELERYKQNANSPKVTEISHKR
ncbi:MAG: hypothetical protein EPN60_09085 [Nevskiaceae bacterium]|nr:MAG: hypothetical protein EPO48_00885 [Nevskiaceae bacterium]TAM27044.1 MAG: hypothetical protein EPN60_09085 [Nevskiaceae bacterium]